MTAPSATVLVVDDEADVRDVLRLVMERAGYAVAEAANGAQALERVRTGRPDLVILDVLMPGENGYSVLARIRDITDLPVLMLTARTAEADKLRGLGGGADDYVTKPFSNAELVARVAVLLRRRRSEGRDAAFEDARIAVDFRKRSVRADGRDVQLSETEWALLAALVRHPDEFLSLRRLLDLVWGDPLGIGPERVKFTVLRLRRRLGWSDPETSPIESRRGAGYRYRTAPPGSAG